MLLKQVSSSSHLVDRLQCSAVVPNRSYRRQVSIMSHRCISHKITAGVAIMLRDEDDDDEYVDLIQSSLHSIPYLAIDL